MIEQVINYINTQISDLNIFKEIKGLCQYVQQVESDEDSTIIKKFPTYYKGKDQLENITDYDFRNGIVFHLKNGDVSNEPQASMRADNPLFKYAVPVKIICIHLRQAISDTAYTPDQFGLNLIKQINKQSINSLRSATGTNKLSITGNNYSTDYENIESVFQNIEINFKEELVMVTVDYTIFIETYQNCQPLFTC